MLSIPSVPQLQKLSLYLKLCVSRIRNSFYIVIVQKLKAILKVVFIAIKQWSHLLLTLSGYNTLCQLKCLKWPDRPFIMWGIHSQEAFPASVILSREKERTPGRCAGGSRSLSRVDTSEISTLLMGMGQTGCSGAWQREEQGCLKASCYSWSDFVT